jgi:L-lactate dehydrogenase complex protein LldG
VVGEDALVSNARAEILERVTAAVGGERESQPVPRTYRRAGGLALAERLELLCGRIADYKADVLRVAPSGVASAVAGACRAHGVQRLVVPDGLPHEWRPAGLELVEDESLTPRELDGVDGVLTGCTVAVAETGTLVLAAGPREGRRAITLVPDVHVCVVEEEQVVELVPEALAILAPLVAGEHRPLTFVSGPSATSDIELSRVEGVHGPRTLVVVLVTEVST